MPLDLLAMAHALVAGWAGPGDVVVDATVGNGHDTEVLARLVGPAGRVVGFDVQEQALEATRARLAAAGLAAELVHMSHARLGEHVPDAVAAVMFNLGYLPGGDKSLVTTTGQTMSGLEAALARLRPGGGMTVMCYPGHPGGAQEADAVTGWAGALDPRRYRVLRCEQLNPAGPAAPPFLIAVEVRG